MTRGRKGYRQAVVLAFGVWLLAGTPVMTTADTSDSYDIKRNKIYGNCRVWTQIDMLTDEESHHLKCQEETFTDVTEVGISQWDLDTGSLELRVGKGLMLHLGDRIPVAIRIDKGKVVRGEWEWFGENMVAILRNHNIITSLMDELARGKRVVIQVGEERGNVVLDGSAAAVKDFRSRIRRLESELSPPQAKQATKVPQASVEQPARRSSPQAAERAQQALAAMRRVHAHRAQAHVQGTSANQARGGIATQMQNIQLQAYQGRVRARIISAWRLPIPSKMVQAFQAVVLLTIDREGQVIRYQLLRSSGSPPFDASLRRAVQAASPLPPLPETFPNETLEAELHFTPPASS